MRRLVRGLASPRDGARQGFGAALIEVLCVFERQVTVESVLELMNNSMQLQGSMKGPEERDVLFGRVFTCAAIVRSHRLERLPAARRAALAPQVCAELLACAAKKSFLQEVAAATLCDALRQLPAAELHDGVCAPLAAQLARPLAEWSPATLLIALTLSAKLPPPAAARLLPHARLRAGRLLHAAQLPALLPALKGASCAHPRLHVVWDAILDDLVGGGAADGGDGAGGAAAEAAEADEAPQRAGKKKKKGKAAAAVPNGVADHGGGDGGGGANGTSDGDLQLVRSFWQVVVADGLVPSTLERKFMAMLLLQAALPKLPPAQLSLALGPALLRTLVDALEGTDRFLRPVAEDTVKGIVAAAQQNAQLRASLVSQLLGRPSASSTTADADAAADDDAAAEGAAADGAERPAKKSGGSAGMQRSTAARALRQLMSQGLDPGGASEYTGYLIARFCKTSSPGTASEDGPAPTAEEDAAAREVRTERAWVLEQLFTLAKGRLARRPPAAAAAAAAAPAADGDGDASKKRRRGDDDAPAAADAAGRRRRACASPTVRCDSSSGGRTLTQNCRNSTRAPQSSPPRSAARRRRRRRRPSSASVASGFGRCWRRRGRRSRRHRAAAPSSARAVRRSRAARARAARAAAASRRRTSGFSRSCEGGGPSSQRAAPRR